MAGVLNMHAARMAMNRDPDLRTWVEEYLKEKERVANGAMTDEEFEQHWRHVKPERMHEGALEAVGVYMQRYEDH
jgi:hypothetical protein